MAISFYTHKKMIMAPSTHSWFFVLCMLSACAMPASSDDAAYANSLLKFKESLTNADELDNWKEPVDKLCSGIIPTWNGLLCNKNGIFTGLRLENMGLGGKIDIDSLSELPLFSISVINNNFSGPFPSDISKLGKLRKLFLANNSFSGEIPDDAFSGMKVLWQVELGYNLFTGNIPMSFLTVPKLKILKLQDNQFKGRIPEFWQDLTVNFSNNKLEGAIPATLRNNDASSFSGNLNLCGAPLDPCKRKQSIKKTAFVVAAVVGVA